MSLEKKFYVYKVYKQFGSRSGLTECQAYSVKPDQVPNCLLLSSPIVLTECQAYSVKPDQVPNCLLLSSPIVLVIVLLYISTRARANIQFTEEFRALHI